MSNPTYISGAGTTSGGFTYTSGQSVDVVSGGLAYNMTIDNKAYEFLDSGGSATTTTINKGGEVDAYGPNAVVSGSLIYGGVQSVTGGNAFNTQVYAGGVEDISSGGADYATTINKSGGEHVYSGGVAYNATVAKGGTEIITQGGAAAGAAVADGGRFIAAGDSLYDTNFTATSGSLKAVGVYKGGIETINITGQKNGKYDQITNTATADGFIRTYNLNGTLDFTEQRIGNEIYFTSGAKTFSSTSPQYTAAGTGDSITVASGGSAVFAGGAITNLTVASGGQEIIGGTTTVHSGGGKYVFKYTGITATDTVVAKGVKEIVNSGNTTLSATIQKGGQEIVKKAATAESSTIDGGTLNLATGAKLKSGLTFKGTGGELEIGGTVTPTTTISGFSTTDKIKFLNVTSAAGAYATCATAGIVEVIDGGVSYHLSIAGATAGEAFNFSSASILTIAPGAAVLDRTASASVTALLMSGGKGS